MKSGWDRLGAAVGKVATLQRLDLEVLGPSIGDRLMFSSLPLLETLSLKLDCRSCDEDAAGGALALRGLAYLRRLRSLRLDFTWLSQNSQADYDEIWQDIGALSSLSKLALRFSYCE